MVLFETIIKGRVPVKKNTARHYRHGVVYSKAYKEWEEVAIAHLQNMGSVQQIDQYCVAKFDFYFKSHRWEPDVSNVCEGPQDVLQKVGIIKDDKLIKRVEAEKHFDSKEDFLAIRIEVLPDDGPYALVSVTDL